MGIFYQFDFSETPFKLAIFNIKPLLILVGVSANNPNINMQQFLMRSCKSGKSKVYIYVTTSKVNTWLFNLSRVKLLLLHVLCLVCTQNKLFYIKNINCPPFSYDSLTPNNCVTKESFKHVTVAVFTALYGFKGCYIT